MQLGQQLFLRCGRQTGHRDLPHRYAVNLGFGGARVFAVSAITFDGRKAIACQVGHFSRQNKFRSFFVKLADLLAGQTVGQQSNGTFQT